MSKHLFDILWGYLCASSFCSDSLIFLGILRSLDVAIYIGGAEEQAYFSIEIGPVFEQGFYLLHQLLLEYYGKNVSMKHMSLKI